MKITLQVIKQKTTKITSKYFEHKKKIIGRTPNKNNTLDTDVVVPSKYLSNF